MSIYECPCGSCIKNNKYNIIKHQNTLKHKKYIDTNLDFNKNTKLQRNTDNLAFAKQKRDFPEENLDKECNTLQAKADEQTSLASENTRLKTEFNNMQVKVDQLQKSNSIGLNYIDITIQIVLNNYIDVNINNMYKIASYFIKPNGERFVCQNSNNIRRIFILYYHPDKNNIYDPIWMCICKYVTQWVNKK